MRWAAFTLVLGALCQFANAGMIFDLDDPSGLSAEVEFTILDPTTLELRARNTSIDVPFGFDESDQILTGISWDFGDPEFSPSDPIILGGTVVIASTSLSLNFDTGDYGPGTDVSGEWGFGNMDGTGALWNFISSSVAVAVPFGGANLDGPVNIDGPQGGLVADPVLVPLNGLGAIQDEIVATLTLDKPIYNLDFLAENLIRVEFGSDAAFITVPEPGVFGLLLAGASLVARRRR